MDVYHKILTGGVIALLLGGVIGFRSWLGEHDARLQAETDVKVRQEAFDKAADQMKVEKAADAERDRQTAATIAQLTTAAAAQRTPAQIASWIPTQVPTPVPFKIEIPAATQQNPTPDAVATIPQADLPTLRDTIAKCQTNAVALVGCQADVASRERQMNLAQTQIEALQAENKDWKNAARKTFWKRAWDGYLKPAIALGGGLAIGRATAKH